MDYHAYIDRKPDGTPFYIGIGNAARVKCVQRNAWHRAIRLRHPSWTRAIVETAPRKDCEEFESFLIAEIGRRDLGKGTLVNFTDGGEGTPNTVVSDATRRKQSAAGKDKTKSPEWRAKISAAHKGKAKSAETCERIRIAKTGTKMPDSHRANTSAAGKKRWGDPAYAEKMSLVSLANWQDPSRRQALSERMTARMSNAETVAAMKDKVSATWRNPELRAAAAARIKGKKWLNKEGVSMRAFPDQLGEFIALGWGLGRK